MDDETETLAQYISRYRKLERDMYYTCECGSILTGNTRYGHKRSDQHQEFVNGDHWKENIIANVVRSLDH